MSQTIAPPPPILPTLTPGPKSPGWWQLVRLVDNPPRLLDDCHPALEYLDATIRESLRLRPVVVFVTRKSVQPFAAGGREYPPRVVLCPCSYLVHRREELYPEPDRFRPERLLERKFGPHEWFPLGGSNRVCVRMPFALYEMKVVLATLLSQVRMARPAGARSRPRRYGLPLGPDDRARVIVRGPTAGL
jgi:cytochrome P450